jgi:asparagine synthase (glutamine-hydrolysing)
MSEQFGRWNFDGELPDSDYMKKAGGLLVPYGPDAGSSYCDGGVSIVYRAFHTTKESRAEVQPHVCRQGFVLTWDGRLDNRSALISQLDNTLGKDSPDVLVAAAAFDRWGTNAFAKLIGDWALSVWQPRKRLLILAKDSIGTRHLFYSVDGAKVIWSSILDPLVLFAGRSFQLNEEYLAGWLSAFPGTQLTPYEGIHAVPPSAFVSVSKSRLQVSKYWDFDPEKRIRYSTDTEYEEHFSTVFAEAVRRRLRSDSAVLAELSGGMDSSSIVCVADELVARDKVDTPRLDTISYYDDSEPNWDERPYFATVENRRNRIGCHIDVSAHQSFASIDEDAGFWAAPGYATPKTDAYAEFRACLKSQGNRVLLSGIGGDEVTGGVPTPIPELEDLMARARLTTLARQLKTWALTKRRPWFHLLFDAMRGFFPIAFSSESAGRQPAPWLTPRFVRRHKYALDGYRRRLRLLGPLPSFQEHISTIGMLRRQLACVPPEADPPFEKRYPYLDRDLLEFLYAIPAEQLVRPGQRRSLARRALVGVVPDEILHRSRKAFIARSPMRAISADLPRLVHLSQEMLSSSLGIVNARAFSQALSDAAAEREIPVVILRRTLGLELWIRALEPAIWPRPGSNGPPLLARPDSCFQKSWPAQKSS